MRNTQPRGFIALLSALIISTVLLLIATGGSLSGFYTRMNSLGNEYKERSFALAEACVQHTLLALLYDPLYAGDATTTLSGSEACYTGSISKTGTAPQDTYTFKTRAYLGNSYTILSVVAKTSDVSLQSETEVPML